MPEEKRRIVVISPMRDEAEFVERTVKSMTSQTLKPVEWLVVDDGSSDATPEIIQNAAKEHPWIHYVRKPDRGERAVGPGVVEAFYYGYERLDTKDYDYICKMDGDIEFRPQYFETLVRYFESDPFLGAASGKPYNEMPDGSLKEERHNNEMVAGMINFYRRECFDEIGGFVREVHWDGIVYHKSRMKGWRTRSIHDPELKFLHLRLMGSSHKSVWHGRMRWGKGQYFMGTHPLYIFAIGVYRMMERPYIIGGIGIVVGYFRAMLAKMRRYEEPGFRESLRAWQMERLHLGHRIEQIPDPQPGLYPS